MNFPNIVKWSGYVVSLIVFFFGFFLFYQQTNEWIGSLFAALFSCALIAGVFIIFYWVAVGFNEFKK